MRSSLGTRPARLRPRCGAQPGERKYREKSHRFGLTWVEGLASTIDGILHTASPATPRQLARGTPRRTHDPTATRRPRGSRPFARRPRPAGRPSRGPVGGARSVPAIPSTPLKRPAIVPKRHGSSLKRPGHTFSTAIFHLPADASSTPFRPTATSPSVRGVGGTSLIGLAAAEAVEQRFETAVQIAAAAEVYAREEGIVNVYSDETPGRELVDQARTALSADDVARATEAGSRLAIKEALDLARASQALVG